LNLKAILCFEVRFFLTNDIIVMLEDKQVINSRFKTKAPNSSLKAMFERTLSVFAVLSSFAAIILFVTYAYLGSPKEWLQKREIEQYSQKIARLDLKMSEMSKRLDEIVERDDNLYRAACDLQLVSPEKRKVGLGGGNRYINLETYQNSKQIISSFQKLDQLGRALYIQSKSFNEVSQKANIQALRMASIPAIQPISIRDLRYISSKYGFRDHPKLHRWIKHTGIDFAAKQGTPIYATGDGVVEKLKISMRNYGIVVVLNHGFGFESLYAHMSKKLVQPGDTIKRGQLIGYVGHTGRVTGDHLHYEVHVDGRSVNPNKFYLNDLSMEEYDDMIFLASLKK